MAKIDLSKFIDNNLKAEFDAKPYDVSKDRAKLIKRFEAAKVQFTTGGNSKAPNKMWKAKNGVVEFKAAVSGVNLTVNGTTTNYIPESQFEPFLDALVAATEAGEFDTAFTASRVAPSGASKATKSASTGKLDTLTKVKQSAGRLRNTGGKSPSDIREYLTEKGVAADWIDAAISNLK
ncbi:hypothetical protein F4U94_22825 [Sphingobium limneticum]|uniref:hypothetical protein n=1 Tax=Sphingobium limneticum TaxID=1007511 RepID=UPI00123D44B3|nr:hypothetical protein [Sphingobium limneticum]KAA9009661.1 hypothetical protein F4U94_22825 [Sphingobium limneticum]